MNRSLLFSKNVSRSFANALKEEGNPQPVEKLRIYVSRVGFGEDTLWFGGKFYTIDKINPGKLIPQKKEFGSPNPKDVIADNPDGGTSLAVLFERLRPLRPGHSGQVDQFGNEFRYRARVWNKNVAQLGRWAWDVYPVAE